MPEKHWKTFVKSRFPWEQEALDFVYAGVPAQDTYTAWANFEFVAEDGSINEVDLLVACPQGVFLIEIKSRPGTVSGDPQNWLWKHDGKRRSEESPLLLANRKCKRLKSLLLRQRAFRKSGDCFFIEPLVFLSHPDVRIQLRDLAANHVCRRDTPDRSGILGAIRRRECAGLRALQMPVVERPVLRTLAQAMDQAGIRPRQTDRRVGDFLLDELLFESASGAYQDWLAHHVSIPKTRRIARIFQVAGQANEDERKILCNAARREFQVLETLDHPGVLRADAPTETELGPVLFLRSDPESVRLDHFVQAHGDELAVDHRMSLLRQIADTVRHAHSRHVIHRSLSPQCIYVAKREDGSVQAQVCNWQTSVRISGTTTSQGTRVSGTLHAGQLLEDGSLAYLAPEALTSAEPRPDLDIFSLGALAYLLFTGKAPASSQAELQEKLRKSAGALDIKESLDSTVEALSDLVKFSANAEVTLRYDITDFLRQLDLVEEQLTQPEIETVSPPQATTGSLLENGCKVLRVLGKGATAIAFLIDRFGQERVLKVARSVELNARIDREFELLKTVDWPQIVSVSDRLEFGDLRGFTMDLAGESTLAEHLRKEGALDLTMLKQFGEDLLRAIQHLDQHGILHRDIKPENIGVRTGRTKKRKELCLFDFSLAGTPPENIRVGTPPYLDPFIAERKVKRWDTSSELFAAAMTLHEMATGVLPKWGDGKTEISLTQGEVKLVGELFPSQLRDRFVEFFRKALRRNYAERFDNPGDMLKSWSELFETMDQPARRLTTHAPETEGARFVIPDQLTEKTQLVLIGLSTRLSNALDRLKVDTVGDLLRFSLRRIYRLSGVGNKTRRELAELCKDLRKRLPDVEVTAAPETDDDEAPPSVESVDLIAHQVADTKRGGKLTEEHKTVQSFLEWKASSEGEVAVWPSQSDLAESLGVSRQRIGQAITAARKRWSRFPSITSLRDDIAELLRGLGGIASHCEVLNAVLAARGSAYDEPERRRMASTALRAALETEKEADDPRFDEYRSGDCIFIAMHADLKTYALRLGQAADKLADEDPLPATARALDRLRAVSFPSLPVEVPELSDNRLLQLACIASDHAVLSSKLEIYPRGLSAERALALAQNVLACPPGASLTADEIRKRVTARYPDSQRLPDRPELDRLVESLGSELRWNDLAANGKGGYESTYRETATYQTSKPFPTRVSTDGTITPGIEVTPEVANARSLEEKLRYAAREGAFLILSVEPQLVNRARQELARRFPISVCDLDAVFLDELRNQADKRKARWEVVLKADAAQPNSTDWRNLQRLVDASLPKIEESLRSKEKTRLAVNPGLLARYDRLNLLAQIAQDVGRTNGIHGLWILVPANDQSPLPLLNHKPIPITNSAQHARITEAWLLNRHRSAQPTA